ncbi:hypothetical protein I4U23_001562 [Adineta vaga]|nr:hypothetical protein I4U23_001562 [Adineta vaga]
MKPTRNNDDEPDVIDLTTCYGPQGVIYFPIPPPSPFADNPLESRIFFQDDDDDDENSNAIMTWSTPTKQQKLTYSMNSNESQSSQTDSKWRRKLNKLLKRGKSIERKQANPSVISNVGHLYSFGRGEKSEVDTLTLRSNNHKRVHWFDEKNIQTNECYQFIEQLQIFVQMILDGENGEYHLEKCYLSLNQLQSLVNYQEIKQEFDELIRLTKKRKSLNTPLPIPSTDAAVGTELGNEYDHDLETSTPLFEDISMLTADSATNSLLCTLQKSLEELKQKTAKHEEILLKLEQSNTTINQNLQDLIKLILSSNQNRCAIGQTTSTSTSNNTVDHQTSMPDTTPLIDSNMIRNTRSDIQHITTTNNLNTKSRSPNGPDAIDQIIREKTQNTATATQPHEISRKIPVRANVTHIINNQASSTIIANPSVTPKSAPERIKKMSRSIMPQPSQQLAIDRNSTTPQNNASDAVRLLFPLQEKLDPKTDRDIELKDERGEYPVVMLRGLNKLQNLSMELNMVSESSNGIFKSIHSICGKGKTNTDTVCRQIPPCDDNIQTIELNDVRYRKKCFNDLKHEGTFRVESYPSGMKKDTKLSSMKVLKEEYNLSEARLAICIKQNDERLLSVPIFYSNVLKESSGIQSTINAIKITFISPSENHIMFDYNNRCRMRLRAQLPDNLRCELAVGDKWFEISLINGNYLSPIYFIKSKDKVNPYYFRIQNITSDISFEIVKRTSSEISARHRFGHLPGSNETWQTIMNSESLLDKFCRFKMRCRLIESKETPGPLTKIDNYGNVESWTSNEYYEGSENAGNIEILIPVGEQTMDARNSRQKRIHEDCDFIYSELPVVKAVKLSESSDEQS